MDDRLMDPMYPRLWVVEIRDGLAGSFLVGPFDYEQDANEWASWNQRRGSQVRKLHIPLKFEDRIQMVLNPPVVVECKDLSDQQLQEALDFRQKARDQKNFQASDAIREVLRICGILVEDSHEGQRYKRV